MVSKESCPARLANQVADEWEKRQNPWKRIWLPGGEHYASTPEDVSLIYSESRAFLTEVLLNQDARFV